MREKTEGKGARGKEENPDPQRGVSNAIDALVALAHLARIGVFNLSAVTHLPKFRRAGASESNPAKKPKATARNYNGIRPHVLFDGRFL